MLHEYGRLGILWWSTGKKTGRRRVLIYGYLTGIILILDFQDGLTVLSLPGRIDCVVSRREFRFFVVKI